MLIYMCELVHSVIHISIYIYVYLGGIFYSSNGGTSWLKSNAPDKAWGGITSSANGQYLSASTDGNSIILSHSKIYS